MYLVGVGGRRCRLYFRDWGETRGLELAVTSSYRGDEALGLREAILCVHTPVAVMHALLHLRVHR